MENITTKKPETRYMDERVAISLAVGRYTRAVAAFEVASAEFNQSCAGIRELLKGPPTRFAVRVAYKLYLV